MFTSKNKSSKYGHISKGYLRWKTQLIALQNGQLSKVKKLAIEAKRELDLKSGKHQLYLPILL